MSLKHISASLIFCLLFTPIISTAQTLPAATQDFRGLWVTKFKTNVLGNEIAENNLLSYAQANDFNYLICTNMFTILTEDCGFFSAEMMDLQDFIEKAHDDYGITYVSGNVGSAATAEKMQNYNNCVDVTDIQKFDMITYECEFYNPSTNGSCPGYASFISQVDDIRAICDATTGSTPSENLIFEVYIGGAGSTGLVITNSSEAEMEEIAETADHILLTYYRSTPFSSGGNFFNWTIQRLEWIASSTATPNNIVLLLKSRDTDTNNMYDYLHGYAGTHYNAVRNPYFCWVDGTAYDAALSEGYIENFDDGTYPWLSGIKVEGFTWFENEANQELEALPVVFLSFDAFPTADKKVELNWMTGEEQNNSGFIVQRSKNGRNWENIQTIKGSNTNHTYNYKTLDNKPLSGISYYRLKQVDFDNSYTFSEIKTINLSQTNTIIVAPNPFYNMLTVVSKTSNRIQIFNLLGQEVAFHIISANHNQGNLVLDLSHLDRGLYIIKSGDAVTKIFKQ